MSRNCVSPTAPTKEKIPTPPTVVPQPKDDGFFVLAKKNSSTTEESITEPEKIYEVVSKSEIISLEQDAFSNASVSAIDFTQQNTYLKTDQITDKSSNGSFFEGAQFNLDDSATFDTVMSLVQDNEDKFSGTVESNANEKKYETCGNRETDELNHMVTEFNTNEQHEIKKNDCIDSGENNFKESEGEKKDDQNSQNVDMELYTLEMETAKDKESEESNNDQDDNELLTEEDVRELMENKEDIKAVKLTKEKYYPPLEETDNKEILNSMKEVEKNDYEDSSENATTESEKDDSQNVENKAISQENKQKVNEVDDEHKDDIVNVDIDSSNIDICTGAKEFSQLNDNLQKHSSEHSVVDNDENEKCLKEASETESEDEEIEYDVSKKVMKQIRNALRAAMSKMDLNK